MSGYISSRFPEDREFKLLPEGEQIVSVINVSQRQSKAGKDMVVFELKAIPDGQLLWHYCLNTGDNRWMLKKTIQAITGILQPTGDVNIAIDDLLNRRMKVEIAHEEYQGKMQAKIADVIIQEEVVTGQTPIEPMEGEDDLPF
jgi:hypothetical protein